MQPVKISIEGDYIDCQVYSGRLYLWTLDGALKVYNWYSVVESLIEKEVDRLTFEYCFLQNDKLYKSSIMELIAVDYEFRNLFSRKFKRVASKEYVIREVEMFDFLIGEQDTPTNIIPTDTEIYGSKLYFINEMGLFSTDAHRKKGLKPVHGKPEKLWDCNLLSIKANKYPQIGLSGGDQGLFELNMADSVGEDLKQVESTAPIFEISTEHSSFSNYTFLSLYNSSLVSKSFMVKFKWNIKEDELTGRKSYTRNFEKNVYEDVIFDESADKKSISWGVGDKIFRASSNTFEVVKYLYKPKAYKGEQSFSKLKSVEFAPWKGDVIAGSTSSFGTIVECENALVILLSDNNFFTIEGPITRWRTYPRSLNYQNHLHVILEDRIDIYSFNQDYFQKQGTKIMGIEHIAD
ncbi:hypothetical protein [Fibrivirga algicola]|uniref:Uncharacterized protein n=1 Tax=Fibrivirga algicola TaxID=2950420 RepID=A0ABX0QLJ9_9BACT|nr:hypothetical protein [Fibrivirga algicola]NID13361.1 hypothetical protein [Fibrivirga algicola]